MRSVWAAAEKLRWSATARKTRSWWRVIDRSSSSGPGASGMPTTIGDDGEPEAEGVLAGPAQQASRRPRHPTRSDAGHGLGAEAQRLPEEALRRAAPGWAGAPQPPRRGHAHPARAD